MKFNKKNDGTYELDVLGYVCPYPQLYAVKSLEQMKPGEIITIIFDNPSSNETIGMVCKKGNHKILEKSMSGGIFKLKIQKA